MVIAIIAILAALLVPAMKEARYMALRTSCSVNVRQQLIGITSYARDHDGKSPPLIDSQMGLVAVYDGVQGTSLRHQDGLNTGFYDGHIAWFEDTTGEYFLPYWEYGGWGELVRRWNDFYAQMDSP